MDWFPPYRAERIEELLAAQPKHSLDSFARMQADSVSRLARELLPAALAARPETEPGRRARTMLEGWKGDMATGLAAPLVFTAWYRELTRLVYSDESVPLNDAWEIRAAFMINVDEGGERL